MGQINTRIVLRNDTKANWDAVKDTATLKPGEFGVETDTGLFKIGKEKSEGVLCTWAELEYANDIPEVDLSTVANNVKQADSLENLGQGTVVGDIGIVKAPLYSGADEYTYTAYVWTYLGKEEDGETDRYDWAAMDGNYSAENVFIPTDIELAGDFGSYKDSRGDTVKVTQIGNKKIGDTFSAGTSIQDIFKGILSQTIQPTKTNPSISISASGSDGVKEVGDIYTKPTATLTVNEGSYTYGYKDANGDKQTGTGVTFPTAKIAVGADDSITTVNQYATASNLTSGGTVSIAASTYASDATTATFTDNTVNYTFSGNASHTAGEKAIDNLGGVSDPLVQIAANDKITATDKTVGFRGYRKTFCGCTGEILTSDVIRGLNLLKERYSNINENGAKATTTAFEVTAPTGATKLVIACPTKSIGKKYALSKAEMMTMSYEDYTDQFVTEAQVAVAGRDGTNNTQSYNVYTYSFAALKADTKFRITLAAANA